MNWGRNGHKVRPKRHLNYLEAETACGRNGLFPMSWIVVHCLYISRLLMM